MEFGIASLSVIPVRQKPEHIAEQVTQILFGELYSVHEKKENWLRIEMAHDRYQGWIHSNQHTELTEQQYKTMQTLPKAIAAELIQTVTNHDRSFPILIGSSLYEFDGMNFKTGKEKFVYSGQAISDTELLTTEHIRKFALKFLNAPYQWGGRNPFGIDCSGLTQIVFKLSGHNLPRDAYQQAEEGKTINFIHEAREGDLAFFKNEENAIVHVGIILSDNQIIHASGKVRIDMIDHFGIFNKELKKYTHQLRIIKRII